MRLSSHNDPNKPKFTLLEPATLRLSLRAWDAYSLYGPLSIFECLSANLIAALRRELNLAVVPTDNASLRPLLVGLLTNVNHDTLADSFKNCKMANAKFNTYDATDPLAMYNYLQRFYVFIDNHSDFFETQYPNSKK
jgi:hypothetical protein